MSDILDEIPFQPTILSSGIEQYLNPRHTTHRGLSLGMEQHDSSFLSRLIDGLIKFLVRMMDDLTDGSTAISLNLNRVITRAENINTVSRTTHRNNKGSSFKIETRLANLSVNFKPVNDPQRLLMYLKTSDVIIRNYFKYQEEELLKVIPSITRMNPGSSTDLDQLVAILNNVSPFAFASSAGFNADNNRMIGPHILGNQQLLVLSKTPDGDPIEQLTGQEFLLQSSDHEVKAPPPFIEYDVFARSIEQSILRQIISTAHDLASRIGMLARLRRSNRVKEVVTYLDLIRKDINQDKYQGEALENAIAFIKLIEAFNNWLVNPYLNLLALSCRNMSAVLNVCEANN